MPHLRRVTTLWGMATKRTLAIGQGRAMVRVRWKKTREPVTVGVCPACWNIPERRRVLLVKLDKMGLEVAFRDDRYEGLYFTDKAHAPGCPHSRLSADPWTRFADTMKGSRSKNGPSKPRSSNS